jgi:hypothetical protein
MTLLVTWKQARGTVEFAIARPKCLYLDNISRADDETVDGVHCISSIYIAETSSMSESS